MFCLVPDKLPILSISDYMMKISRRFFSCAFSVLLISISGCGIFQPAIRFSADFESGNLPVAKQLDRQGTAWELALRNDNDNASLPNAFRTWWYLRADHVPVRQNLRLEFSRLGSRYYFVPVYSFDQKQWHYFDQNQVAMEPGCYVDRPETCRIVINTQFAEPTVWIARTFPYTTQDLFAFLTSVSESKYLEITQLGVSPRFQKPLQLVTINDKAISSPKQTIWIHARTHPAETGPSFVLEGLIRAVLAEDALGSALRQQYVFKIVPMHNLDGVVLGNYRTNASSINLENHWLFAPESLPELDANAPEENRLVNRGGMVPVALDQDAPVVLALNLHSSNADPDTAAFFFPHFGSDPKYSPAQQNLWQQQLAFIKLMAINFDGRIEQPPQNVGAGFVNTFFPEAWWWAIKEDAVNAMTLETTYGRAGFDHWITEEDLRNLGVALAKSINDLNTPQAQQADDMSMFRLPFKPGLYRSERRSERIEPEKP